MKDEKPKPRVAACILRFFEECERNRIKRRLKAAFKRNKVNKRESING